MKNFYDSKDFPTYIPQLRSLYDDLFSGGKGLRSQLIYKISQTLSLPSATIHLLAQTIEFIHNASLLHDDFLDRSLLRRNKKAAWLKFTPEQAILAGDYLLSRVMLKLSVYGNLKLIEFTARIISNLLEGEWIQDSLVKDWNINLSRLDRVHLLKTASLFKWCFRTPFLCKENNNETLHETLEEMGGIAGLLFQRGDDLLDYDIRNEEKKAVLGDLKSGYLNSFGIVLYEKLQKEKREQFKKAQTIDEVKQIVTEEVFNKSLEEFDKENQKFIDLYNHYVECLDKELKPEEKPLLEIFYNIPQAVYWRKKDVRVSHRT